MKDWADRLVRKYFLCSYENMSLMFSTYLKKLQPVQVGTCMCAVFNLGVGETEDPGEGAVG